MKQGGGNGCGKDISSLGVWNINNMLNRDVGRSNKVNFNLTRTGGGGMIKASFDFNGRVFMFSSLRELKKFCMKNAQTCSPREVVRCHKNYMEVIQIKKAKLPPYWKF